MSDSRIYTAVPVRFSRLPREKEEDEGAEREKRRENIGVDRKYVAGWNKLLAVGPLIDRKRMREAEENITRCETASPRDDRQKTLTSVEFKAD